MIERAAPSTIVDVAKAAGVSVATVSRALRGLDRVSAQTRAKVQQVADELHYVASPTATSLASGRTHIIGVVVPFASRWYFASMVSALGKALRAQGYQVLLFDLEENEFNTRLTLTRSMLWKRVDGVVSINVPMSEDELQLLRSLHVPVVSLGYWFPDLATVGINDAEAARLATQHVIDLGHHDIAYVGSELEDAALTHTPRSRCEAFTECLRSHGRTVRPDWIVPSDWTAAQSRALGESLLTGPGPRPSAVVCGSDEIAFGVQVAARAAGLRLPEELSIVGIDDHALAELFDLTTVRQDISAQAEQASALLLAELRNPDPAWAPSIEMPVELIVRGSTAPPPAP
ncbi:MAG: LacI family DNA-binding transcriptional regulator [Actinomycetia bacterium]|nr:LacI family DNA-binding transcriptional regulator [Actinomycetes bacterium]